MTAAVAVKTGSLKSERIPRRHMDFKFPAESKRYYYGDDPFLTTFWGALSSLFPAGERFFVDAVRSYRDRPEIKNDAQLQAEIAGFIGQEAMHTKEHLGFNEMLTKQGFPVDNLERDVGALLKFVQKVTPKRFHLAATVCLEHYTAIIAEQLLRDPNHQKLADPELLKLWLWHALEENEHKNVAYDVYKRTGGSELLRMGTMIPTTIVFFIVLAIFQTRMLAADKQLLNVGQNLKGAVYFWGPSGLFARLAPQYFDFFRFGFHPSDHDTEQLLADWREKLFGKDGTMVKNLKKIF